MHLRSSARRAKRPQLALIPALVAAALSTGGTPAHAFSFDPDNPELKVRWDNTFKYSAGVRLKQRSDVVMADARADDGDRNFGRGLVSNRLDILSELDASYQSFGLRISGAGWYDDVYNKSNDNNDAATSNNASVAYNEFTRATRDRMGRKAELMDAFAFVRGSVGGMAGTLRVGRHTLVFGESLFFGANGIANAQGPVDIVKLLNVPSSQFKEILRPVNQISGQLQLSQNLSMSAYYQLKWEKSILPPAGSYLSSVDFLGEGAERFNTLWTRGSDIKARDSGQGGLQLRYRSEALETEFGFYAARYHDKTPQIYLTIDAAAPLPFLPFTPHNLVHAYAEDIRTYGLSASTVLGDASVAAEMSIRENAPLVSDVVLVQYNAGVDNRDNGAYAVGKTAHAQISSVYLLPTTSLWQGASLLAEAAWNRTLSVTRNRTALDPNTTRDAYAVRIVFAPSYYQVLPGLDINVPLGLGYNPRGRSSAVNGFNGGVEHGGDLSIGLTGEYESKWNFGINYIKYLGREQSFLTPPNSNAAMLSYGQALKDRDFISLNVKRTF